MSKLQEVNTTELPYLLRSIWEAEYAPTVMLHGPPGFGKSSIIQFVANRMKYKVYDVRLPQIESVDLRGLPVPNVATGQTSWLPPDLFPSEAEVDTMLQSGEYKGAIIFLDEISSAKSDVQVAAYQLIQDRRCGNYEIPSRSDFPIHIVAAGNNLSDMAIVYNMSSALKNRMVHFEMKLDVAGWIEWTVRNNFDPAIPAYIKNNPQDLHYTLNKDFRLLADDYAFQTPRSWEMVNDLIKNESDLKLAKIKVAGAVGPAVAAKFYAYLEMSKQIPSIVDVLDGHPFNVNDLNHITQYTFMYSLVSYVINQIENIEAEKIDNFLGALNNIPSELAAVALNILSKTSKVHQKLLRFRGTNSYAKLYQKLGQVSGILNGTTK